MVIATVVTTDDLAVMIAFATLILMIIDHKRK